MFYVYLLKLNSGKFYVGFSVDLKQRIKTHVLGKVKAAFKSRPLSLVFYCAFKNKKKALDFEKYLKSSSGFAFRNKRLL
jgi:putative endonuclease